MSYEIEQLQKSFKCICIILVLNVILTLSCTVTCVYLMMHRDKTTNHSEEIYPTAPVTAKNLSKAKDNASQSADHNDNQNPSKGVENRDSDAASSTEDQSKQEEADTTAAPDNTGDTYPDNMVAVTTAILENAQLIEEQGNLYLRVWHNVIYHDSSEATDPYTRRGGGEIPDDPFYRDCPDLYDDYYDDFNDALEKLCNDSDYQEKEAQIAANHQNIEQLMGTLSNPPKQYKKAYSDLKNMYDAYDKFRNCIDQRGSYNTISDAFAECDDNLISCYKFFEKNFE